MILGDHDVLKVPFLMQTAGTFQPDILLDMIEVHEVVEIQIHLEIHNKKVEVLYWNTASRLGLLRVPSVVPVVYTEF